MEWRKKGQALTETAIAGPVFLATIILLILTILFTVLTYFQSTLMMGALANGAVSYTQTVPSGLSLVATLPASPVPPECMGCPPECIQSCNFPWCPPHCCGCQPSYSYPEFPLSSFACYIPIPTWGVVISGQRSAFECLLDGAYGKITLSVDRGLFRGGIEVSR